MTKNSTTSASTSVSTSGGDALANPSRRRFIGLAAGATAGLAAGGGWLAQRDGGNWPTLGAGGTGAADGTGGTGGTEGATSLVPTRLPISSVGGPIENRTLIVVELDGGNDGLATLEPYDNARLQRLRQGLLHEPDELLMVDDEVGFNPSLVGLHEQGLAVLEGVGTTEPDFSHFEMYRRWSAGSETGDLPGTGFLGRICDELEAGAPVTGLSIGGTGHVPPLVAAKAVTLGLTDPNAGWFFRESEDPWYDSFRRHVLAMARDDEASPLMTTARTGATRAVEFADVLGDFEDEERPVEYPGSNLGQSLAVAANLLRADTGLRVIHIPHSGFDTHDDQRGNHDYLLMELNDALSAFREELEMHDLTDTTLIATTSEFGRRPQQNGSGTDHGAASVALIAGPVVNGRHGEMPSLTALDDEDNLVSTVSMGEYYATLAAWFGVDPQLVLEGKPKPLEGLLV